MYSSPVPLVGVDIAPTLQSAYVTSGAENLPLCAGTGKSVLLREIIQHCGGRDAGTLAITAATGIASVNIGGCTLHSWAGVGIGKETKEQLLGRLLGYDKYLRQKENASDGQASQNRVVARWRRVKTLIVDESRPRNCRTSLVSDLHIFASIDDRW